MIAFAAAITDKEMYERCALKGFQLAAEPDTEILGYPADGSIFRSYNMLLDSGSSAGPDGLESLVLVHQDAEIIDPDFIPKVREALADPDVAIVGCAGALDVRSIAWWEGSVTWASFTHRFDELGGGEIPALSWRRERMPPYAETGRGRLDRRLRDGALTLGDRATCASTSRWGGSTATTSTSACRPGRGQEGGHRPDLRVVHHHSLQLITRTRAGSTPTCGCREVGRGAAGRQRTTGAGGRAAPRRSSRRPGSPRERAADLATAPPAARRRAPTTTRTASRGASPPRCAGSRGGIRRRGPFRRARRKRSYEVPGLPRHVECVAELAPARRPACRADVAPRAARPS